MGEGRHSLLLVSGLLLAARGRRETRPGGARGARGRLIGASCWRHNKGKGRRERGKEGDGEACAVEGMGISLTP